MADTTTTYITSTNQHSSRITLKGLEQRVVIDGQEQTIEWRNIAALALHELATRREGGRYHLVVGNRSYEIYARRLDKTEGHEDNRYEIQIGGQYFEVSIEDERTKLLTGTIRTASSSNAARISAPMPGLVIGTPLAAGSTVIAGQTVIVLEAMKMENDLASPISGTIKEVRVNIGQTVELGQVLVIVEGEKSK
jgi:biotin carboxyl carrier protein